MYGVILAGGGGTRLWPLSTRETPKPFLPLLPEGSLLRRTVDRLLEGHELGLAAGDLTVVTDQRYASLVRYTLADDRAGVAVIAEPFGRNTATAIALAVLAIDRPDDEVMIVLPADHAIDRKREGVFRAVLKGAAVHLAEGAFGIESPIVTLGAQANYPATEYGYLIPDTSRGDTFGGLRAYPLSAFEEKPTAQRAAELRREPGVAWNAGIFMARRRAFRQAFAEFTPLIGQLAPAMSSVDAMRTAYDSVQPMSIDYAVMEKAAAVGNVVMGAMDVGWSDLGTWSALVDRLAGGYEGGARVVPPGEPVALASDDVCVLREATSGVLGFEPGPLHAVASDEPIAFLPAARQHTKVIRDLIERTNSWERQVRVAAMAPHGVAS